jgi:hypothetical protein
MGKDKPDDFESQYEREEGKTSSLLARLKRSIWHSGRVVILDSGFCVLQARELAPYDFESQYEREEGKTSSLLARLTRSIWHSWKVVILDSGFCVQQALGKVSLEPVFFEHAAEVRDSPKFLRIE